MSTPPSTNTTNDAEKAEILLARTRVVMCQPYDCLVVIVISDPKVALSAALSNVHKFVHAGLKKQWVDFRGGKTTYMPVEGRGRSLAIWMTPRPSINTIAHEAFHAADMLLTDSGLKLNDGSDEAWAYLIGWFAKEIHRTAFGKAEKA